MTLPFFSQLSFAMLALVGAALPLHAASPSGAEPYALVRDGQRTTFVGSHRSGDTEVESLKAKYPGNFIWFRQAGKAYVVRDQATLAKVAAAWAPADKLGQEMKQLDAPMREKSTAMTALAQEMVSAVQGGKDRGGAGEAMGKRMDALGKEMNVLGKQMDALGKQVERESKQADATSRALMQAALASGAAQIVPAATR